MLCREWIFLYCFFVAEVHALPATRDSNTHIRFSLLEWRCVFFGDDDTTLTGEAQATLHTNRNDRPTARPEPNPNDRQLSSKLPLHALAHVLSVVHTTVGWMVVGKQTSQAAAAATTAVWAL